MAFNLDPNDENVRHAECRAMDDRAHAAANACGYDSFDAEMYRGFAAAKWQEFQEDFGK
ncbi:hypothetical protein AB0I00_06840 [Streptomyces sp. NPDC050803]|uniref:hypothetical protein n=1 Tax=unclassified Streptomyces TaxID=2593676 RepID=UPI003447F711